MKKWFQGITKLVTLVSMVFALVTISIAAYAQAVSGTVDVVVDPNTEFLNFLIASLGGVKGATTLAIVGLVVKIVVKFLDLPFVENFLGSKFTDWTGGVKLTIVLTLSFVGGIVGLMSPPTSLTFGAALVHSTTLSAFLVLSNQIWKQYLEKKKV